MNLPDSKALSNLVWLSQLGVSIIAPPVLCIWGASWLVVRFDLGAWVMVLSIILGIGASVSSAMAFYKIAIRKANMGKKDDPTSFNSHR